MTTTVRAAPQQRPAALVAVAIFLASEAVFFLALLLCFAYLRATSAPEHLGGAGLLDAPRAALFTGLLVASSGTVWVAERAHVRGSRGGARLWLAATVLLGLAFLGGQASEYAALYAQGLTPATNVFGTQFYTLTGIHFLHVSAGVLMLAIRAGLALRGGPGEPGAAAIGPVALYWHFVDVVWLVLFTVLYVQGVPR